MSSPSGKSTSPFSPASSSPPPPSPPSPSIIDKVKKIIQQCCQQYLTEPQIIAVCQQQHDIDPVLTAWVLKILCEQNSDYFANYDIQLRLRDQVSAYNYLVQKQVECDKALK